MDRRPLPLAQARRQAGNTECEATGSMSSTVISVVGGRASFVFAEAGERTVCRLYELRTVSVKTKIATVPAVMPSQARALLSELLYQFWFLFS